jgi:hypothetical protein
MQDDIYDEFLNQTDDQLTTDAIFSMKGTRIALSPLILAKSVDSTQDFIGILLNLPLRDSEPKELFTTASFLPLIQKLFQQIHINSELRAAKVNFYVLKFLRIFQELEDLRNSPTNFVIRSPALEADLTDPKQQEIISAGEYQLDKLEDLRNRLVS